VNRQRVRPSDLRVDGGPAITGVAHGAIASYRGDDPVDRQLADSVVGGSFFKDLSEFSEVKVARAVYSHGARPAKPRPIPFGNQGRDAIRVRCLTIHHRGDKSVGGNFPDVRAAE